MILIIIAAFVLGFFAQSMLKNSNMKNNPLTTTDDKKPQVPLPTDLVKISGCIPFEGEHYVRPTDVPFGPFYVINDGKLMAIEYMFEEADIPGEKYAKMTFPDLIGYMQKNKLALKDIVNDSQSLSFDLKNANFTYSDLHWTAPHAGVVKPHFDLHFYFAPREEMQKVCPDSTIQDVLPEDLVKDILKSGVPLPK